MYCTFQEGNANYPIQEGPELSGQAVPVPWPCINCSFTVRGRLKLSKLGSSGCAEAPTPHSASTATSLFNPIPAVCSSVSCRASHPLLTQHGWGLFPFPPEIQHKASRKREKCSSCKPVSTTHQS